MGLIGLKAGLTGLLGLKGLMGLTGLTGLAGGEKGPLEEDDYNQEFQEFDDTIINIFQKRSGNETGSFRYKTLCLPCKIQQA